MFCLSTQQGALEGHACCALLCSGPAVLRVHSCEVDLACLQRTAVHCCAAELPAAWVERFSITPRSTTPAAQSCSGADEWNYRGSVCPQAHP